MAELASDLEKLHHLLLALMVRNVEQDWDDESDDDIRDIDLLFDRGLILWAIVVLRRLRNNATASLETN